MMAGKLRGLWDRDSFCLKNQGDKGQQVGCGGWRLIPDNQV